MGLVGKSHQYRGNFNIQVDLRQLRPSNAQMILREAKWLDRICVHDYSFLGVPVDSIEVVETGTAYIRFCKKCGLEVERVEK